MKKAILVVTAVVLAGQVSAGFDPMQAQAALEAGLAGTNASAAQAAVVRNGQVVWSGFAGSRSTTDPTPATGESLFALASIGKTYTAALALKLVEKGMLSLDEPISAYVPATVPGAGSVTPRMLLNHTAGYPDVYRNPEVVQKVLDSNFAWTRAGLLEYVEAPVVPGTAFEYSNTNYILLGEVLERASGVSVERLFEEVIGGPLQLTNTFVELQARERYAIGVLQFDGTTLSPFDSTTGVPTALHGAEFMDGGVAANAVETGLFMDAVVRGDLLGAEMTAEMLDFGDESGYGLGIYPATFSGVEYIGHDGAWLGYSTVAFYQPDIDATVVVLTNGENFDGDAPVLVVFEALSAVVVPEPAGLAPAIGALALVLRRRR